MKSAAGFHLSEKRSPSSPQARALGLNLLEMLLEGNCTLAQVKDLLRWGADPNVESDSGSIPLHVAIAKEQEDIVHALIAAGADIDRPSAGSGARGYTALHFAVARDQGKAVFVLLRAGADFTLKSEEGETPEMLARRLNKGLMAEVLSNEGLRRATEGFSRGLVKDFPVPPPLILKKRPLPARRS